MALTIQNTPGTFYSVNGDLIFVVCDIIKASDPITYPDYRYICDVYVGTTLVTRLKAYPRPDNLMGVFNVSNVLRNYIANNFSPTAAQLKAQELGDGAFSLKATMKFGDEYNFVLNTNVTVDSERTYFGHYNGRLVGIDTILADKMGHVISTRPYATPVNQDATFCLVPFAYHDGSSDIIIQVKSYTKSGTLMGTYTSGAISKSGVFDTQLLFNVAPSVINAASPGLIVKGVTGYYTVEFQTAEVDPDSIYRFDLVCEPKYDIFTLHFLNRYGGFESRDFTKVSRKTIDIDKQEFGKLGYTMDSSGVVSYKNTNNVYNETRSIFSTQFKEKMTLNTDILTDDEYTWLADLILSPQVYMQDSGYFMPVVIAASNYEFHKVINDKLTNLTLNLEFGEQLNSQYR